MKKQLVAVILMFTVQHYSLTAQHLTQIRLDIENARGGTVSQVFGSIHFLPLETTKESLFGSIDQLEVSDSFLFVLDIRSRSIIIFNKEGKFHARINSGGIDKYFSYFTIDRTRKYIYVTNNFANSLLVYDFNGKNAGQQSCPASVQTLYYFGGDTVLYNFKRPFTQNRGKAAPFDLGYSHGFDSMARYLYPYNTKFQDGEYNISANPFNFSGEAGSCMFSLPFDYNVLQIGDTGVINQYHFILPQQFSLPPHFATDSMYSGHRAQFAYSNPENSKLIHGFSAVYKAGDFLLFSAPSGQLTMGADWNYAYNLTTKNLVSFSKVSGDSSTGFIPILSSMLEKVDAVFNQTIYTSVPSFRIFSIKNELNRSVQYPASLQRLLMKGSKDDNPVIVQFTMNKQFK